MEIKKLIGAWSVILLLTACKQGQLPFLVQSYPHEDYGNHSGLGLSICKQIVMAHNGMIFAENNNKSGVQRKKILRVYSLVRQICLM